MRHVCILLVCEHFLNIGLDKEILILHRFYKAFPKGYEEFVADITGDGPGPWEGSPLICGVHSLCSDLVYAGETAC